MAILKIFFILSGSGLLLILVIFLMISSEGQKFSILMKSSLLFFSSMGLTFGVEAKRCLPNPGSQDFLLYFPLKALWVFGVNSGVCCEVGSGSFFFACGLSFVPASFVLKAALCQAGGLRN